MKLKSLTTAAVAAALAVTAIPAAASAQDSAATQVYGSVGYSHASFDEVKLGAINSRLGVRFGQYFGVEGEAAFGVKDDSINVSGTDVGVELNNSFAAYGVAFLPVAPNFEVFARVGYGTSEIEASAGGFSASADGGSWNYGLGGQYFFDDSNGFRADYTRHDFEGGDDANVWSIGYVRKF